MNLPGTIRCVVVRLPEDEQKEEYLPSYFLNLDELKMFFLSVIDAYT